MGIKRHKPEEIVSKLRQVEVLVGQGRARADRSGGTASTGERSSADRASRNRRPAGKRRRRLRPRARR